MRISTNLADIQHNRFRLDLHDNYSLIRGSHSHRPHCRRMDYVHHMVFDTCLLYMPQFEDNLRFVCISLCAQNGKKKNLQIVRV